MKGKRYVYGKHWAPHDIAVRELGTGKSRLEVAASYGLKFQVTPRLTGGHNEVEDGIHAARLLLAKMRRLPVLRDVEIRNGLRFSGAGPR